MMRQNEKAMAMAAQLFAARKSQKSWVYISTFDSFIKVGTTIKQPSARLKEISKRYNAECRLLGAMEGDRRDEQNILRALQQYRAFGRTGSKEVFDIPPNVLSLVLQLFGVKQ